MPQPTQEVRNRFNDIIGEPPRWIIQGGIAAILIVWLMLIVFCVNMPVPEAASSVIYIIPDPNRAVITSTIDSAIIKHRNVNNRDHVDKQQQLFTIEGKSTKVLSSPKEGYISFQNYNNPGQWLSKGDTIATIIQLQSILYGYTSINTEQGKAISKGDQVNISVYGYSPSEYGYLPGTVKEILDKDGRTCEIQITIPGKLVTTFHKTIPLSPIIIGKSSFVFKGKSIFQHLNQ